MSCITWLNNPIRYIACTRFGKKRIEEELVTLNTKFTCLGSLNDGETTAERLQEEIKEYKAILKCSVCHDRPKEVSILNPTFIFLNVSVFVSDLSVIALNVAKGKLQCSFSS